MKSILVVFLLTISVESFGQTEEAFSLDDGSNSADSIQGLDDVLEDSPDDTASDNESIRSELPDSPSDLGQLIPYKDIAVIQRRYLSKSKRVELTPFIGLVANNSFYLNNPLGANISYYLSDYLSIEATAAYILKSDRSVTRKLASDKWMVGIESVMLPRSFYDVGFKVSQAYGKLGFFKNKIAPFDMYLGLGVGQTYTNQTLGNTKPMSYRINTGQIFAINKMMAFKWDISWRIYYYDNTGHINRGNQNNVVSETSEEQTSAPIKMKGWNTDIYFTLGLSLFFPDAEYR